MTRLHDAAVKALGVAAVHARLEEDGSTASPLASAEFARFIKSERERWGNVVRKAGLKAE